MRDWIQGDKFVKMADYTYAPAIKSVSAYDGLENTLNVETLKDGDVVYTHSFYVKQLFEVLKDVDKKIVLITHNADVNIDSSFIAPPCVVKWYAQNVNVIDPRIVSIPIGLENDRWFADVHKKEKMEVKLREPRIYKNLIYMNHNIATNPAKRLKPFQILNGKLWVTTDMRANGDNFDGYLDNIYNHKFVVCPEGNGIDTHRIWECLYMGTIPIVENNINNSFYHKLPILTVNNWESVSEDKLLLAFVPLYICEKHKEMLTFEYWKNKIREFSNSLIGN